MNLVDLRMWRKMQAEVDGPLIGLCCWGGASPYVANKEGSALKTALLIVVTVTSTNRTYSKVIELSHTQKWNSRFWNGL